jgi:hypothetical protein
MLRDEATFALATREIFGPFQIITSYTDDQLPLGNTHTHFDNHTHTHFNNHTRTHHAWRETPSSRRTAPATHVLLSPYAL